MFRSILAGTILFGSTLLSVATPAQAQARPYSLDCGRYGGYPTVVGDCIDDEFALKKQQEQQLIRDIKAGRYDGVACRQFGDDGYVRAASMCAGRRFDRKREYEKQLRRERRQYSPVRRQPQYRQSSGHYPQQPAYQSCRLPNIMRGGQCLAPHY